MMGLLMGPAAEGQSNKLIIVLEPANLEALRHGQPIHKPMSQFFADGTDASKFDLILAYTPDIEWFVEELTRTGSFGKAMDDSMKRPAVFRRGDVAETMSRLL